MALPRTLPTEYVFPTLPSNLGPFYVNGAVYIVGLEWVSGAGSTYIQVWKSSDPDTTAFTMLDADTAIVAAAEVYAYSVSCWLDGNILHVAAASKDASATDAVRYHRFDTSTDQWDGLHGAWGQAVNLFGGDGDPVNPFCDIRVHTVSSTEYIQIVYNGGQGKVHGTNYERFYIATYNGSSWTTNRVFDNSATTGTASYRSHGLAVGTAGHVHGLGSNGTTGTGTVGVGTVDSANNIQPWEDTVASVPLSNGPCGTGVADGNNIHFRRNTAGASNTVNSNFEFTSADPVTDLTENIVMTGTLTTVSYLRGIAADGSDIYTFYVLSADGDLRYDLNDGTTDAVALTLSLSTSDELSIGPASYTVGSRSVIGILYDDGGTKAYDELSVSTTTPGEVSEAASLNTKVPSEVSAAASINIKLPSEVAEPGSVNVALRGEQSNAASAEIALRSEVFDLASTNIKALSETANDASVNMALRSEVSDPASANVALPGEQADDASVLVMLLSEVSESASVNISTSAAGEVSNDASVNIALPGEVSEPASLNVALRGEVSNDASAEIALRGEVSNAASIEIKQTGEVAATASLNAQVSSEVVESGSVEISVPSEVAETASVEIALPGQQFESGSINVKVPSEVSAAASANIAATTLGEVAATASLNVKLRSEVAETGSVNVALQSEVSEVGSLNIALQGEVAADASTEIALQSEVSESASVEIALPGQVVEDASVNVALVGEISETASVNLALQGQVSAAASIRLKGPHQVFTPDSDSINAGPWTDELGGTTNIYQSIDETRADESDYIESPGG